MKGILIFVVLVFANECCFAQHWFADLAIKDMKANWNRRYNSPVKGYLICIGLPPINYEEKVKEEKIRKISLKANGKQYEVFNFDKSGRLIRHYDHGEYLWSLQNDSYHRSSYLTSNLKGIYYYSYDSTNNVEFIELYRIYNSIKKIDISITQFKHEQDSAGRCVKKTEIVHEATRPLGLADVANKDSLKQILGIYYDSIFYEASDVYSYHSNGKMATWDFAYKDTLIRRAAFDTLGRRLFYFGTEFHYSSVGRHRKEDVYYETTKSNRSINYSNLKKKKAESKLKYRYYYIEDEKGYLRKRVKMLSFDETCEEIVTYDTVGRITESIYFDYTNKSGYGREPWSICSYVYSDSILTHRVRSFFHNNELAPLWEIRDSTFYNSKGKVKEERIYAWRTMACALERKAHSKYFWKKNGLLEKAILQDIKYDYKWDQFYVKTKELEVEYEYYE